MIKKLFILLIVLVLLLVVAVIGVGAFAGSIAKAGVEKGGTYALGVDTKVNSVSLSLLGGRFSMNGLNVATPAGFTAPHFLNLGEGSVSVALGSLMSDTIHVPTFTLDTLDVQLERKDGKANYNVILDNLKKVSGGGAGGGGGGKPAPQPSGGSEKKLVIDDLAIRHIVIHLKLLDAPGGLGKITIPIDEIRIQNLGKSGASGASVNGLTLSELSSIIVQAVMSAAVEKGGGVIPADVLGDLKGGLESLGGLKDVGFKVLGDAKGTVEQLGAEAAKAAEGVKKVGEDVKKGVDDVKKGLEGLIPKK